MTAAKSRKDAATNSIIPVLQNITPTFSTHPNEAADRSIR